jgi:hypothetical protein
MYKILITGLALALVACGPDTVPVYKITCKGNGGQKYEFTNVNTYKVGKIVGRQFIETYSVSGCNFFGSPRYSLIKQVTAVYLSCETEQVGTQKLVC